ncbi:MAG: hypothetical protein KGY39_01800 [Anaerolineales bacterium]|nr:hypothetical protein [Anaerolineales bacterium]MBS3752455.1 hypothetical protein [Anaerolineales bacterium]
MRQKTIPVKKQSRILIQNVGGDLSLKSWKRPEIRLQGIGEHDRLEKTAQEFILEIAGDLAISTPHQLAVEVNNAGGDASLANLPSPLSVKNLGGDLSLRDVNAAAISNVGGDLFAKHVRGDLTIKHVGGDCLVNDVDGQYADQGVGGDLHLSKIAGGIETTAGGDIQAIFSPVSWQAYDLRAGKSLYAQIPEDTNAVFKIKSEEASIQLNIDGESQTIQEKEYEFEMGEGGTQVLLSAGGEVMVSTETKKWSPEFSFDADFEGLAEQISQQTTDQIQSQLSSLEKNLKENLSHVAKSLESFDLSEEKMEQVRAKIEEAGLRAAQKAQKAAQKAEAKLEYKIAKAQRKARRKRKSFNLEDFLAQDAEEKGSVTEDERLMILNMLEEKKISAQQADELLAALEGKE